MFTDTARWDKVVRGVEFDVWVAVEKIRKVSVGQVKRSRHCKSRRKKLGKWFAVVISEEIPRWI